MSLLIILSVRVISGLFAAQGAAELTRFF